MDISNFKTETIRVGSSNVVDRIKKQYDDLPIAFQKEAIQNSWDARYPKKGPHEEQGKGWSVKIDTFNDDGMTHLVIEDFGTTGMSAKKWDAFQSLWLPDKDSIDAGGQGQGKFILMSASTDHLLIVESVSDEIAYRCRFLINDEKSKGDVLLRKFISRATPLDHKGTRVWVYNIEKKFLDSIRSSNFADYIIESWWQILGERFNKTIELFDTKISNGYNLREVESTTLLENYEIENYGRIKRLVLNFYNETIPQIFQGIRVQRANMMVCKIPFEISSKENAGRFSGYVEFDEILEKNLKEIEKTDHCGFQYKSPWSEIKALVKDEAKKFVDQHMPQKEHKVNINLKNLPKIIQKANSIINDYCPEVIGGGSFVPLITPSPKPPLYIKYLHTNKKEAEYSDIVKISCSIFNGTGEEKKINLHTELKRSTAKIFESDYRLKISKGGQQVIRFSEIKMDKHNLDKGKYTFRVTIQEGHHDGDSKSTSFYLETKRDSVKKGFIKSLSYYQSDEPVRNKAIKDGAISVNLGHNDFGSVYSEFENNPNTLNKHVGFYMVKICLDEALNEFLKVKIRGSQDPDDIIEEIREMRDKMYYDIYV